MLLRGVDVCDNLDDVVLDLDDDYFAVLSNINDNLFSLVQLGNDHRFIFLNSSFHLGSNLGVQFSSGHFHFLKNILSISNNLDSLLGDSNVDLFAAFDDKVFEILSTLLEFIECLNDSRFVLFNFCLHKFLDVAVGVLDSNLYFCPHSQHVSNDFNALISDPHVHVMNTINNNLLELAHIL